MSERRLLSCIAEWPDCYTGGYDPRCCRFPKSCSAGVYDERYVGDDAIEPELEVSDESATVAQPTLAEVERRAERERRREAEYSRRDAEADEQARLNALVNAAAIRAPRVLPGDVGETLAAALEAMKPFRAADGHLSIRSVGRTSPEVVALASAILALTSASPAKGEVSNNYAEEAKR